MTFELNGKRIRVLESADLTRRLLDVLRQDFGLMGTKEGCGEGECGACIVFVDGEIQNACLVPLANVIGHSVVTIEGFKGTPLYTDIAEAYHRHGAVQCGYCTPGMVMATAALVKRHVEEHSSQDMSCISLEAVKDGLAGNLCRCTGYQTICEAVQALGDSASTYNWDNLFFPLAEMYELECDSVNGSDYSCGKHYRPSSVSEAITILSEAVATERPHTVLAGGTDLMIRKRNWQGTRRRFDGDVIFIQQIDELKRVRRSQHLLEIGATATQSEIAVHPDVPEYIREVVRQMGTPAIREVATMGGNIVNGASVADTLVPWFALDASVLLRSARGDRLLPIQKFLLGKYKTALAPDELLVSICIPLPDIADFHYQKIGNRKASVLSKLSVLILKESGGRHRIAIGAVNDKVIRNVNLELAYLENGDLDQLICGYESMLNAHDDKRSTKDYREKVTLNIVKAYLEGGQRYDR